MCWKYNLEVFFSSDVLLIIAVIQITVNVNESHDRSASNGGSSTLSRPAIGHGFLHFETQKMGTSLRPSRHNSRVITVKILTPI